jgi:hypothetical protein
MWRALGGAGLVGVVVGMMIVGRSGHVAGDPVSSGSDTTPPLGSQNPDFHEPGTTYDLGPGAIPYDKQPADEQLNIDRVHDTREHERIR